MTMLLIEDSCICGAQYKGHCETNTGTFSNRSDAYEQHKRWLNDHAVCRAQKTSNQLKTDNPAEIREGITINTEDLEGITGALQSYIECAALLEGIEKYDDNGGGSKIAAEVIEVHRLTASESRKTIEKYRKKEK